MFKTKGMSLIELIVVLVILTLLTCIGISFNTTFYQKNTLTQETQRLFHTLQYAKTQAIKTKKNVAICPSKNGLTCTENWEDGFIVFYSNTNPLKIIRYTNFKHHSINITAAISLNQNKLIFAPTGRAIYNGTLSLSNPSNHSILNKVIVYYSGRIRIENLKTIE